jgi:hypothetical protein
MRTKLMAVIALLVTTGLLAGCIVEPGGYGYGCDSAWKKDPV